MKFYYINNFLCEDCNGCSVACPSGAVYAAGGKRYIIHDKCTSCGVCIRTCGHNAVSIESIDAMVERMENADLYLGRIRSLEQELTAVNGKLDDLEADFGLLLVNHPSAAAVCDREGNVKLSNDRYKKISGDRSHRTAPGGENLRGLFPPEAVSDIENGGFKERCEFTTEIAGKNFGVVGIPLSAGSVLWIFDDLTDGHITAARITEALNKAVRNQVEMVRKIGTILGDGASSALNEINAALDLIEASASVKE
ncbi:MAG: 4Fe-4S binding protein [Rikenellaceae bacterium]|nr:4Fe-4S binding protein [Rikenellaceae bacterium]